MVGLSKIERRGSSRDSRSRTLATTWVASSECPPSSKKSSSTPDPARAQQLAPDLGQRPLGRGLRRPVGPPAVQPAGVRRRQGAPVQLAAGGQRQPIQDHEDRGHHGLRQPRAQELRAARPPRAGRRRRPGRRPGVARRARPARARRPPAATPGCSASAGLDLAGLDAVAADLHLLVDAPEQVERARREPAGQVPGAVEAAARRSVRVGHEALGGEVGPVEVALRNAEAAEEELADRHRSGPAAGRRRGRGPGCSRSGVRSAPRPARSPAPASARSC